MPFGGMRSALAETKQKVAAGRDALEHIGVERFAKC
jgi:hypothetical protein